jgi:Ni/Co efflux regulator RcnB
MAGPAMADPQWQGQPGQGDQQYAPQRDHHDPHDQQYAAQRDPHDQQYGYQHAHHDRRDDRRYYEGWGGVSRDQARGFAHDQGVYGYQPLPPEMHRHLRRGYRLPPEVVMRPVPPQLIARLPARPGYQWRVAGSDLVLVAVSTAIVADVLADVLR